MGPRPSEVDPEGRRPAAATDRHRRLTLPGRVARLPRTIVGLGGVSFFNDLSSEIIYPLLPTFLVRVLGASLPAVGLIEGTAESVNSLVKLFAGRLSDRLGRRKPFITLGYALAAITRPLLAATGAVWQALSLRALDRLGKGMRTPPRDALLAEAAEPGTLGLAFAWQRGMDHAGALLGPLVAGGLLLWVTGNLRLIFAFAALPAFIGLALLWRVVREAPAPHTDADPIEPPIAGPLAPRLRRVLLVFFLFALSNSSDAFLLLRAGELGVATVALPFLWAAFHASKALFSLPGGDLADRLGPRFAIAAGWAAYVLVYLGFGLAWTEWQAWALFVVYGVYFGLAEGPERAMIARLADRARLGGALGSYHLAVGAAALPASVGFGFLWQLTGSRGAFLVGAALAAVALTLLWAFVRDPS